MKSEPLSPGKCAQCETPNPSDNRFCTECGAGLYEPCPACNAENRIGTKFCGKCGVDMAQFRLGALERELPIILAECSNLINERKFETALLRIEQGLARVGSEPRLSELRTRAQAGFKETFEQENRLLLHERRFVTVLRRLENAPVWAKDLEGEVAIRQNANHAIAQAQKTTIRADELRLQKRLHEAIAEYARALEICTDYADAGEGLKQVKSSTRLRVGIIAVAAVSLLALACWWLSSRIRVNDSVALSSMIGKKISERKIQSLLSAIGGQPEISRSKDGYTYYVFESRGIELKFDQNERLHMVFLYSKYQGKLPYGLSFGLNRRKIESILGEPETSIAEWSKYPGKGISITYESPDPNNYDALVVDVRISNKILQ